MFKFFKSIDNFLTNCEEYIEQRVWNGKFIYDLTFISATETEKAKDSYLKHKKKVQDSPSYKALATALTHIWGILMRIPVFGDSLSILLDGIRLCIKYILHYLIILIFELTSASWLLGAFQKSPFVFCLILVPILLVNLLVLSGFFSLVVKRERGGHITMSESLSQTGQSLASNTFLFLLQVSITVSLGTFYLGFSSLLSFLFGKFNIDWSNSFFYWMPIVMMGLLLLVILYLTTLIIVFSYIFILLDKKKTSQAINQSWHYLQNDPKHSVTFYFSLTLVTFLYIVFASINNYEGGFAVSVLFSSQAFLFLGFLLKRKYYSKDVTPTLNLFGKLHPPLKPLLAIGLLSYVAFSIYIIKTQPAIMQIITKDRETVTIKYDLKTYSNTDFHYSIMYPKTWSLYRWSNHSVTLYTNDTGTDVGAVKVDIDVHPESTSNYLQLYEAKPGLVIYDTATKDVLTKIANVSIQGENAVKFIYTKVSDAQSEYQTHYLVHHNNLVYDIDFVTSSKKSDEEYGDLFDQIIKSFKFNDQNPK